MSSTESGKAAEPFTAELSQARQLKNSGQFQAAAGIYQQILARSPEHYEASYSLGMLLHESGRSDLAIPLLTRSVRLRPEIFAGVVNLGLMQRATGQLHESTRNLERAIEMQPGTALAHSALALNRLDQGQFDEALAAMKHCLELEPDNALHWSRLGMIYQVRNETADAEKAFRKAIKLQPDWMEPRRSLMLLRRQDKAGETVDWLARAWDEAPRAPDQRILIAFTLGKVHDDLGRFEQAFDWLTRGHALQLEVSGEIPGDEAAFFTRHREHLGIALREHCSGHEVQDETPVFVLGMPRSGTSLCEQILASHPAVYGAGEVEHLRLFADVVHRTGNKPFPDGILDVPPQDLAETAQQYLSLLRRNAGDARRVVDKVPNNFLRIGLIATLFPNACIVLCEREARANCLSIFQNVFGPGHAWASDLSSLGAYYRQYQALVEHWDTLFPGRILRMPYEDLVSDTETQIRRLLEHSGLGFHEDCMKFYQTRRQVRTPSEAQVRQPVYGSSLERWRNYEPFLEPLFRSLQTG